MKKILRDGVVFSGDGRVCWLTLNTSLEIRLFRIFKRASGWLISKNPKSSQMTKKLVVKSSLQPKKVRFLIKKSWPFYEKTRAKLPFWKKIKNKKCAILRKNSSRWQQKKWKNEAKKVFFWNLVIFIRKKVRKNFFHFLYFLVFFALFEVKNDKNTKKLVQLDEERRQTTKKLEVLANWRGQFTKKIG